MTAVTYNSQLLSKALKQIFSSLILFLSSNFYFSLFSFFSYFSRVKLWFSIKLIATEFFQRHLIVGWLCNNILKIRQNRFGETWEKLAKIFILQHRTPNFRKITNSDKPFDNCFLFLKNFRYNVANVFWVVLVLKTPIKWVRNTWVSVSSWRLSTGYPATSLSSHSVDQAVIFFIYDGI